MKKVLLATSMLVATAGFAAAEVSLTGDGRMGIRYNGDDWNFSSRARVKFNLSGESDSGLSFGAAFRADQVTKSGSNSAHEGAAGSIWVSGAFGKIEMGDTVGAAEAVLFDLPEVGFTDLDLSIASLGGRSGSNELDFLTGDGADDITKNGNPSLLYTYSFNDFTVAASFTDGKVGQSSTPDEQAYALAASYSFGDYSIGAAYEVLDYAAGGKAKAAWLAGTAAFGDTKVYLAYGDFKDRGIWDNQIGLGISSKFDAVTVSAYVKRTNLTIVDGTIGDDKVTDYGIGAAYNLGGGASIVGGIADNDANGSKAIADLGLKFTF